jgi:hypothetical protein
MSKEENIPFKNEQKEEKNIIPDQLNIIIRTSIPGYQKIEYKPSMTIKDIDSKGILFNPLIKLDQSKINKIPQEYKIKQFFNKGLFQSLLNYNGGTPAKNLLYATKSGYVNNNIKVTLDTLFPVNSVIYIGKNPYAIGDVQWTTGDWKIEVKQKKTEIDISKITDPRLYSQLVSDEIISGENQLSQLPEAVLTGNNYTGPPIASGVKKEASTSFQSVSNLPIQSQPTSNNTKIQSSDNITKSTPEQKIETQIIQNIPSKPINKFQPTPPSNIISTIEQPKSTIEQPKNILQIEDKPVPPIVEELSPEDEKIFQPFIKSLKKNRQSKLEFSNFFKSDAFYSISNSIYLQLSKKNKNELLNFYKFVTQPKNYRPGENLSKTMYNDLCDLVSIIETPSDGNCFFAAVSNGINIYNYENQGNKIIYNIYGKTQLFTINVLREMVVKYYNKLNQNIKENLFVIAEANVDNLNKKFSRSILDNKPQTNEEYIERLNYIYSSDENFFVYKPSTIPIDVDKYSSPFRILTEGEIPSYIKSKNYWGDQFSMEALCNILGIYIIPIEKIKKTSELNKNLKLYRLTAILREPDQIKGICSKKILFLYRKNLHYELIRFKYLKQKVTEKDMIKKLETIGKWYTIFDKNNFPPPYHILILIYGSNYINLNKEIRSNYEIYNDIMLHINYSVIKNVYNKNLKFINTFNNIFNVKNSILNYVYANNDDKSLVTFNSSNPNIDKKDENENISGGQSAIKPSNIPYGYPQYPPYGYPQYPPYGYPQYPPYGYPQYPNRFITKKPQEQNMSKIAYSITIDMEVHPGTSLTPKQINESKCNSKYNSIRKAFSEFTGKPYIIPPVYKENTNIPAVNKDTNINKKNLNNTRKILPSPSVSFGNVKNKTIHKR